MTVGECTAVGRQRCAGKGWGTCLQRVRGLVGDQGIAHVRTCPVAASHTRAVPSPLAVTMRVPSGLHAALVT